MTPESVIQNFPASGTQIGDGFQVIYSLAEEDTDGFGRSRFDIIELQKLPGTDELDPAWLDEGVQIVKFVKTPLNLALNIEYRYEIERTETASFVADTDIQEAVIGIEKEIEEINLRSLTQSESRSPWLPDKNYTAGDEVIDGSRAYRARNDHLSGKQREPAEWVEIGETSYLSSRRISSFLKTSRGAALIAHIEERARARARLASRCVYVSFEAAIPRNPHDVTPDCMISITSPKLPGGSAVGRLISYTLNWSGGRWSFSGTIACSAGSSSLDTLSLGSANGAVGNSYGRLDIQVENGGDDQEQALIDAQTTNAEGDPVISDVEVPETTITITTTPAPNTALEQSMNIPISGQIGIPQQVTL